MVRRSAFNNRSVVIPFGWQPRARETIIIPIHSFAGRGSPRFRNLVISDFYVRN
jgi:hypothetical protein